MPFTAPSKKIRSEQDLEVWKNSNTYTEICQFIEALADSVRGKPNDAQIEESAEVNQVIFILDHISEDVDKFPVKDKESSRFGKQEFRDFYDYVQESSNALLMILTLLDPEGIKTISKEALVELQGYFTESWGNRTRIDYGSGHELNFLCFLLCLEKLGYFTKEDHPALVLKVFNRYIHVMRKLQRIYWLEPAGSHGVWGLDDYHFLPFLFGAAQLATHPRLKPKSIHNNEYVDMFKDKYMYFHCIWFVNLVKTALLRWHSPMLDDISGVKSWAKVAEGMVKMYKAEVLGKLPVMQHFLFGSLIPSPEGLSSSGNVGEVNHVHTWGDCCGIRLPSAIAAREMGSIPFD